jgi:hypothetical protein
VFDGEKAPVSSEFGSFASAPRDAKGFVCVFGSGSGGEFSDGPRRRRVGAATVALDGSTFDWEPCAGFSITVPGKVQTVPRAELTAFAEALERTVGNLRYITDHLPILRVWSQGERVRQLRNGDLWTRIFRAARGRGAEVIVEWAPSHVSVDELDCTSEREVFRAVGNECADALAGRAARLNWSEFTLGFVPETDRRDAEAALVRRRARRALEDCARVDPWTAARPERPEAPPVPALSRVLKASAHEWRKVGPKFVCLRCSRFETRASMK